MLRNRVVHRRPSDTQGDLAADKKVAQKMLADLIEKTERGITDDPFAAALKRPVDEHLDEFEQHLISKNNTAESYRLKSARKRIKAKEEV